MLKKGLKYTSIGVLERVKDVKKLPKLKGLKKNIQPSPLALKMLQLIYKHNQIFITGGGGVGKSYLTKELLSLFENPLKLASSNLAASIINGGTVHKAFKLKICKSLKELKKEDEISTESYSRFTGKSLELSAIEHLDKTRELIANADVIFIDEVSMLSAQLLDLVRYRLQSLLGSDSIIPIIFVGDLFQLQPVSKPNEPKQEMIFYSDFFKPYIAELTVIKRAKDLDFIKVLTAIRNGKAYPYVGRFITEHSFEDTEPELSVIRIFPTNDEVVRHNGKVYRSHKGKEFKFNGKVINSYKHNINKAREAEILKTDISAEVNLKLKIGLKIIFLYNKVDEEGNNLFYNGETGYVEAIGKDTAYIKIRKASCGTSLKVFTETFSKVSYKNVSGKFQRVVELELIQFPLKMASALTVHKTQGMTIDEPIFINCHRNFTTAQLYVAMSRVTKPDYVMLSGVVPKHIKVNKDTFAYYQEKREKGELEIFDDY